MKNKIVCINEIFIKWSILLINITISSGITFAQNSRIQLPQSLIDFADRPTIKWEFKTQAPIYSSPVVQENLVYFGGLDSILYVLDITTGAEKWRFHTRGEIRSDVCIGDNKLFLNGGDGNLYAMNKESGKLLWTFQTRGEMKYDFADYFHSSPLLDKGILYFGSGDGYFYAVSADSGKLIWSFNAGNIIHTKPAIDNGKLFFGCFDGNVYALNLPDGKLIWKFKTVGHRYFPKGEVQGSPAAFNNMVFIGARDYNVYAIDQEKGYCHWNKAFVEGWGLSNTIHDSVLYIGSSDERIMIAARPGTGEEIWNIDMEFLVFGNNAFSENMLYVGTTNGKLHGINKFTGEKIWSFETETYQKNRFSYFKTDDSYRDDIYSIITSSEQFLDVECLLGGVFSTPVIIGDVILFTSTNGILYCLRRHL